MIRLGQGRKGVGFLVAGLLSCGGLVGAAEASANVSAWGSDGAGDGQFRFPAGLDVDSAGNVYVADRDNHRIQKFSNTGRFVSEWGSAGTGDSQFQMPIGVATSPFDQVYISEYAGHRVQRFLPTGSFVNAFGGPGATDGRFEAPFDVAVAPDGKVFVADNGNGRVQRFSATGEFETSWLARYPSSTGSGPIAIAVASNGRVLVAYPGNGGAVGAFDRDGNPQASWGGDGTVAVNNPQGLATGPRNTLFVMDVGDDARIRRLDASGRQVGVLDPARLGRGSSYPQGLAARNGIVFISELRTPLSDARIVRIDTTAATARIAAGPNPAYVGSPVHFDARASSSTALSSIVNYEWDLDGDGTFELNTGARPTADRSYGSPGDVRATVRVRAESGKTATASIAVGVRTPPPPGELGVSINDGDIATDDPNVRLSLVWPQFAHSLIVSNDGGFAPSLSGVFAVQSNVPWRLRSSGSERLPKTIYVRFRGGSSGQETYTDDIILDETNPRVASATLASSTRSSAASVARRRARRVRLKATDNAAGLVRYQFRTGRKRARSRRVTRRRRVSKLVAAPRSRGKLAVRVQDAAGNWSRWRGVRRKRR